MKRKEGSKEDARKTKPLFGTRLQPSRLPKTKIPAPSNLINSIKSLKAYNPGTKDCNATSILEEFPSSRTDTRSTNSLRVDLLNEPGPSRRTHFHTPNTIERKVTRAITKQNTCEQLEMRKRKLANCQNSEAEQQDAAKKPFLQTNRKRTESNETNSPVKKKISIEQPCSSPNRQSQIPRLTQTQNKPNHQTKPKIPTIQDWLSIYQSWSDQDQKNAINQLIEMAHPNNVRYMREVIEPRFQRDFISLLPRTLALNVLANLSPKDLMSCAQTCKAWRQLADDNLLWSQKCRNDRIEECPPAIKQKYLSKKRFNLISGSNDHSPWKEAYLRKKKIELSWEKGNIKPKELIGHDDHVVTCLQFDGNRIVSGSDDNTLKVWNASTGMCSATLQGHTGGVWCLEMKDDLIVSGSTDRSLRVWDAASGECRRALYGHSSTVRCMAMKDNYVVSGSRDNTLRLWNLDTFQCEGVLQGHVAAVRCVCFDGKKIVSGSYDYTVKIWDPHVENGSKLLFTLQGHQQRVYSLQFDGKTVVSGSLDTNIMVWCASTGRLLHTLTGHQSLTSGMELRNNILVSGNADSTVKMWDIRSGDLIRTLDGQFKHESAVTSLQYNGKFIITSSDDGTVKLWSSETGKQIRDLVELRSRRNGGVVWRIKASETKLVCAVGSRNGTEITKLMVLDFGESLGENQQIKCNETVLEEEAMVSGNLSQMRLSHVNPT